MNNEYSVGAWEHGTCVLYCVGRVSHLIRMIGMDDGDGLFEMIPWSSVQQQDGWRFECTLRDKEFSK